MGGKEKGKDRGERKIKERKGGKKGKCGEGKGKAGQGRKGKGGKEERNKVFRRHVGLSKHIDSLHSVIDALLKIPAER